MLVAIVVTRAQPAQFLGVQGFLASVRESAPTSRTASVAPSLPTAETQARQPGHASRRSRCCARRNLCTPGRSRSSNATIIMRATL